MFSLLHYREFGVPDAPFLVDRLNNQPYEGKDEIIRYLRHEGKEADFISMSPPRDYYTGQRIPGGGFYSDGEYGWRDSLAYYVEKYNARLPHQFEEHVHRYYG